MEKILEIKDLVINFKTDESIVNAVKRISFDIPKGKTVGLVGESGSGKSVTSLATMRLIPTPPGKIDHGEILFQGRDLLKLKEKEMQKVRGKKISMIFQEPMTSLNPVFTVGDQVSETLMLHENLNKEEARKKTIQLFDQVGIPEPKKRITSYPHEMSGGQRQRVMIAMAIACSPELLIADEPTTALDVTIQKQILELLAGLQKKFNMSVLFITHDLGVIADIADEVVVMYKGNIVEKGTTKDIFLNPQHPYTKGLLCCRPSLDSNPKRLPMVSDFMDEKGNQKSNQKSNEKGNQKEGVGSNNSNNSNNPNNKVEKYIRPIDEIENPVVLEIKNLSTHFPIEKNFFGKPIHFLKAVDKVSLKVRKGRTLGLVGESGCGKTTLGRTVLRLIEPTSGDVIYKGKNLPRLNKREMRTLRRDMQIIFQDPYASLNPRMTIGSAIMEPMTIHKLFSKKEERIQRAKKLLLKVGLDDSVMNRYPHEFSGGQRQRICIARALAVEPEFIICDESVSALDVSVQAQILNLLLDLQEELGLTYIFISHDLAVVKFISDEVAVMNNGKIIELSDCISIYKNPQQDYTKKLLSAIPKGL